MSTTSPFPPVPRTPAPDAELDDAVARLHAVRAAGRPRPGDAAPPGDQRPDDALAERLRARRSAGHVAAAYSAVHGHPLGPGAGHDDETPGGGRRWALGTRAAAVAGAAVLVVGLAAGVVTLWPRGGVELLPVADGAAAAGTGASDVAPPGTATEASAEGTGAGAAEAPGPASLGGAAGGTDAAAASVVVHVVGQVAAPGIVTLPAGARVADALDAAGGPTAEADLAAVNLARAVVDGEQVYVPAPGEPLPATAGPAGGTGAPAGAAGAGGTGTGGPGAGGLVDLNTADAATLETLPGIGPVLAERIVAWRTEHGPFASVDELGEVSGIGPSILAGLRDAARV